jgi:hypothetical protein
VLLDFAAVTVEDSAVPDLCPVDSEGFGGLDADAVYSDVKIPVDGGLAATDATSQPFPLTGGLISIAGWRLIATSGASTSSDHWGELRVRLEGVGDLVRNSFRGGIRWQDQIDVDRNGCRCGNDSRCRVCAKRVWVAAVRALPAIRMSFLLAGPAYFASDNCASRKLSLAQAKSFELKPSKRLISSITKIRR